MSTPTKQIPAELPEKPTGWRKVMDMHMSLGDGGTASYTVFDAEGNRTVIAYGYRTYRQEPKKGWSGFTLPGDSTVYKTWAELRAAWSAYYRSTLEGA